MAEHAPWTILGTSQEADAFRAAARFVDPKAAVTLVAGGADLPSGAIATSAASLHPDAERVASTLLGFRVLEDALGMLRRGELGEIYSCFGSIRMQRGSSRDEVVREALTPLLTYALTLFPQPIERIWSRTGSIESADDSWFVTLRFADEVIVTLEALASADPVNGPELLVEIIGSEQVVRCEPMRQAVSAEPVHRAAELLPWWEDPFERLLELLADDDAPTVDGARLRAAFEAVTAG